MRRKAFLLIICSLICIGAYRWGDTKWENAKVSAMEYMYMEIAKTMAPYRNMYEKEVAELMKKDLERFFVPVMGIFRATRYEKVVEVVKKEETNEEKLPEKQPESQGMSGDQMVAGNRLPQVNVSDIPSSQMFEKKVVINRAKLLEFDYLRQNFYQVDNTTTVDHNLLDVNKLLGKDMTIKKDVKGPQILIYHTHSQEAYKDSKPGDASMSIVAVGDYLEKLLEEKYGIEVLHHKGQYDVDSRDGAYSKSRPDLEKILKENPSIEVVIDLHRDGVPEKLHLVTEIDGKPTAQLMFFNGLSYTTSRGKLDHLANPYIEDNLALSFQMQLAAAEYYPGLTRKIYLKGYRYNLHLKPKSMLVEVGAQTNTFQEALNAMEPLSNLLGLILVENSYE